MRPRVPGPPCWTGPGTGMQATIGNGPRPPLTTPLGLRCQFRGRYHPVGSIGFGYLYGPAECPIRAFYWVRLRMPTTCTGTVNTLAVSAICLATSGSHHD